MASQQLPEYYVTYCTLGVKRKVEGKERGAALGGDFSPGERRQSGPSSSQLRVQLGDVRSLRREWCHVICIVIRTTSAKMSVASWPTDDDRGPGRVRLVRVKRVPSSEFHSAAAAARLNGTKCATAPPVTLPSPASRPCAAGSRVWISRRLSDFWSHYSIQQVPSTTLTKLIRQV